MTPTHLSESAYPITFRKSDAATLGEHLKLRHSIELVGMKRVGISNFLRFFLYHPDIVGTYISKRERHLFIPVDLNDLVERELQPFWILTLKRLVDITETVSIPDVAKQKISTLFLQSIQLHDNFLTIENIKKALLLLIEEGFIPTIFLLRFDRMRNTATSEFFNNLQGLIEATGRQLALVFTSDRPLDQIRPDIFSREELTTFSHRMYLSPAHQSDAQMIFTTFQEKYDKEHPQEIDKIAITLAGGHMQYLYLAQIILYEKLSKRDMHTYNPDLISSWISSDERIKLQSEEIFESLTKAEKDAVRALASGKLVPTTRDTQYLFETGIINKSQFFSPLFSEFLQKITRVSESTEFSKKEHLLYSFLHENQGEICERDKIIHAVWPESEEVGVSDWTIDRLVARLRHKLTIQKSKHTIVTVKTRGYKLVQS